MQISLQRENLTAPGESRCKRPARSSHSLVAGGIGKELIQTRSNLIDVAAVNQHAGNAILEGIPRPSRLSGKNRQSVSRSLQKNHTERLLPATNRSGRHKKEIGTLV